MRVFNFIVLLNNSSELKVLYEDNFRGGDVGNVLSVITACCRKWLDAQLQSESKHLPHPAS
jgi:hypothetical protein